MDHPARCVGGGAPPHLLDTNTGIWEHHPAVLVPTSRQGLRGGGASWSICWAFEQLAIHTLWRRSCDREQAALFAPVCCTHWQIVCIKHVENDATSHQRLAERLLVFCAVISGRVGYPWIVRAISFQYSSGSHQVFKWPGWVWEASLSPVSGHYRFQVAYSVSWWYSIQLCTLLNSLSLSLSLSSLFLCKLKCARGLATCKVVIPL